MDYHLGTNQIVEEKKQRKKFDHTSFSLNLDRVLSGEEKRTTLMIKNIPNKYDQDSLLEAINVNFVGLYDFFYLPMDFKNKCNVGYAFINFINPKSYVGFFSRI